MQSYAPNAALYNNDDDNDNDNNNNKHILRKVLIYETYFTGEITLHVAQTVNTEQLQHCIHYKHGLFQVYNCKYRAQR